MGHRDRNHMALGLFIAKSVRLNCILSTILRRSMRSPSNGTISPRFYSCGQSWSMPFELMIKPVAGVAPSRCRFWFSHSETHPAPFACQLLTHARGHLSTVLQSHSLYGLLFLLLSSSSSPQYSSVSSATLHLVSTSSVNTTQIQISPKRRVSSLAFPRTSQANSRQNVSQPRLQLEQTSLPIIWHWYTL